MKGDYPHFKATYTQDELVEHFLLSPENAPSSTLVMVTVMDKRLGDFTGQMDRRFGDLGARVTSLENWMRWGVGILLLSWLTLMTSIWLK